MIVIPSREDNAGPARTEGPRLFQFRHPTYLLCSNRVGEILHFVQDDSAFVAAGA
jgi:hypothetical protein